MRIKFIGAGSAAASNSVMGVIDPLPDGRKRSRPRPVIALTCDKGSSIVSKLGAGKHTVAARRYSRVINFVDEIVDGEPSEKTTVDIFSNDGNKWYCQVRRGDQQTQPLGPYTKLQAERIQDARRMLIARKGTARLEFERERVD